MTKFFTTTDGARIAYRDEGAGPALLCLAGLTRSATDFDYVLPYLTGVRTIRMDYRGRGQSEWSGAKTYTIQRESLDALALLDHLGLSSASILGTSRGGIIAMGLAAHAPDRIGGVMLNDVGPVLEPAGLTTIRNYIGRNPVEKTYREAAKTRAGLSPGFADVAPARWEQEVRLHYRQTADGLMIRYDPELAGAVMASLNAPPVDLWPLFETLAGRPLAALRGANSQLLSASTFAQMQAKMPNMIAAEVPNRGHVPFLDEPASLQVLEEFLKEIR